MTDKAKAVVQIGLKISSFCYLGDRLNAKGSYKAVFTSIE